MAPKDSGVCFQFAKSSSCKYGETCKYSHDGPTRKSRKTSTKLKGKPKEWSMYPSLHDNVSSLLRENNLFFDFHKNDDPKDCIKEYDTNIMGLFTCHNPACTSRSWKSKKIAITIRMYPREQYNARVYHQRCEACGVVSKPQVDDSYAERVAYRVKKWRGVDMEVPPYSRQKGLPHKRELCEGCKYGHCSDLTEWH